jgi:hypothetical protein
MRSATAAVVLLMLAPMLSGCFGGGEESLDEPENVFDTLCPEGIASNVWYHYANATDAPTTSSIVADQYISPIENARSGSCIGRIRVMIPNIARNTFRAECIEYILRLIQRLLSSTEAARQHWSQHQQYDCCGGTAHIPPAST